MQIPDAVKQWLPKLLPYAAVLVVGIGIGWGVKPAQVRVEEKLKEVTVEKQVVVTQEKVNVVHVKDTQVVERWHREKTEVKTPDGTVTKKEVEDKNVDSVVHENTNSVKVVEVEKQVVVVQDRVVEKKVEPVLAQWHLGVLGGVSPQFSPTIGVNSWMVGGEVEHRVVGPLFVGVWGMGSTTGQGLGGLKVGAEF